MTITSNRFVMLITIWIASPSACRRRALATFRRAVRHEFPAGRRLSSTGGHNQFTFEYGASRRLIGRSAARVESADPWLPCVGAEHDSDRAVVDQPDRHLRSERPGLDPQPAGAKAADKPFEQGPSLPRPGGMQAARAVMHAADRKQGGLRAGQGVR